MKLFSPVTLCAVLGCGLMSGLFFAFSICVMKALSQLAPDKGMAAMQAINVSILNPVFFVVFMGTAVACIYALISSLRHWNSPGAHFLFGGSLCYLLGVLLVTAVVNVPMNDALAAAHPTSAEGARLWASYLTTWTAWNHVRTIASLAATALFALAQCQSARP